MTSASDQGVAMLSKLLRKTAPEPPVPPARPKTFPVYVSIKPYQVLIDFVFPGQIEKFLWRAESGVAQIDDNSIRRAYSLYAERVSPRLHGLRIDVDRLTFSQRDQEMGWLLGHMFWQSCLEQVDQAKRKPLGPEDPQYKAACVELSTADWHLIESSCDQIWREWRKKTPYRVTLYSSERSGHRREEKTYGGISALDGTEVWKCSFQEEAQRR